MPRARRWAILIGLGVLVLAVGRGTAQKRAIVFDPTEPPAASTGNATLYSSVKISEDSKFRRIISAGRDCINDQEWNQAVQALQAILNEKKDYYVQISEIDPVNIKRDIKRWASVKFEANNLIGAMPKAGLETYEQTYGAEAKIMLEEAKRLGDRDMLADVAQRYCHTKAGIEANEIMATLFLARGQVFTAALRFEKLLAMNPDWAKLSDLTLFKAALAFRRAGDTKNYEEVYKRLETMPGVKAGDDVIPLAKLQTVLNETPVVDVVNRFDWPSRGGNDRNSAQAMGSPPLLDARLWRRPMLNDQMEGLDDTNTFDDGFAGRIDKAISEAAKANQAILPGFFPIASQGLMVYRNYRYVIAVTLKEREVKDEASGISVKYQPGDIVWRNIVFDRSLAGLHDKKRVKVDSWLDAYEKVAPGFNSFLYDNTLVGSLVTDHKYVYAINDFGVPPHPGAFFTNNFGNPNQGNMVLGDFKRPIMQNQLQAYELQTGKMAWDLNSDGRDVWGGDPASDRRIDDADFKHSHFISLPILIAGKLYVLNEKLSNPEQNVGMNPWGGWGNPIPGESELRLVCLDPNQLESDTEKFNGFRPKIVDTQSLGTVMMNDRFVQDLSRRVNAIYLAYGDGVLVCPTNAGEVFGIDLMSRSLVWSYSYRESPHQQIQIGPIQPNVFLPGGGNGIRPNSFNTNIVISKWKSSPPSIQDGLVVFTAPDADSIHCVNLRDGKPVWKRGQSKGDLFLAGVFQGKALVVAESTMRAIDIRTGTIAWSVSTGDLPSGQGVASKGVYYLPLRRGEILAVDIASGLIKAHNRASTSGAAPGNLVFYEGMVLSQTPTEVCAYPQLVARLETARAELTSEPNNLAKLTEYGDLLLKDGQVQKAVDTLVQVHDKKPTGALQTRLRERLFEAINELAGVDFPKVSRDYLPLYKELCSVAGDEAAEEARKAKFLRAVGQGREAQGDLVTAFSMYKDFGALPTHRAQGVASPENPLYKIPVNVWLRGRVGGMMAKAAPEQRVPLEARIAEEWKAVEAKKDLDAIRSFVGMFDVPVRVGRDARIKLAETIMERNDRDAFLEAELALQQVRGNDYARDPASGGRALAVLAQLEEKKGTAESMRLAAAYYRALSRQFPADKIRGGKTGADLFNELATDKRFLPYLEEAGNPWGAAKLTASEAKLTNGYVSAGFVMQPDGDDTPFARQHRLVLDAVNQSNPTITLRDIATNQNRWTTALGSVPMNALIYQHLYQQAGMQAYHPGARFRYFHVKGHLIVCQVGVMIYCLDGDTGKKLWEMQNVDSLPTNGFIRLNQVIADAEGNPEFLFWNQQTNQQFRVTLGRIGAVQASYVAVLGHKGLSVVDPLKGTPLWKKADVPMNSHLFGDDQYLFLAEATEAGGIGVGRTYRASDGELQAVPDFSTVYPSRVRLLGRQILATRATPTYNALRLYDILTGKDVWSKEFPTGAAVLHSEEPGLTGMIDPKGNLAILDLATGKEILSTRLAHGRITTEEFKGLQAPLLLADAEHYYLALNKPLDERKITGTVHANFNNGTRCLPINGWVLALHRQDGQRQTKAGAIAWKRGDLAWHTSQPMLNQMLVMEQIEQLPILLFSSRYVEVLPNGGTRWTARTNVFSKATGVWIYDHPQTGPFNGSPLYNAVVTDWKHRSINLMGFSSAVQIYVDDGKPAPPVPQLAAGDHSANPNAAFDVKTYIRANMPGNAAAPVIRVPALRQIVVEDVQPLPPPNVGR